jgi:hypothetical protein
MDAKTNTLHKYIDVFGEAELISAIKKIKEKKPSGNIAGITNPVARFLIHTNYVKSSKLYARTGMRVPPEDYSYFRLVSAVLADLVSEITQNNSYKKQLVTKLFGPQSGPMLAALNEILVAAYYKYLGIKVSLNSSEQAGAADINLVDLPFATDTKIFRNDRLLFEAIVNESSSSIMDAVRLISDQGLLLNVFNPNKKNFQKSMKELAKTFAADASAGQYEDSTLFATIMNNDYPGADFHINVQPQNINVFFQASWNMGPLIEDLRNKEIEKAVKQAKALSKQAIPWIMVPRDASRNGIEVQILRFEGKFHQYVFDHKDIFIMPVYSLEFSGKGIAVIMDVYQTGSNTLGINAETFQGFIKDLMSRPELYV